MRRATVALSLLTCVMTASVSGAADRGESCRTLLVQLQQLDVLHDLDWKPGKIPKVVVGPTFHQLPFEKKQQFAATVNCFLMNGKDQVIGFDLLDHLNHRVVGTWKYGKYTAKP